MVLVACLTALLGTSPDFDEGAKLYDAMQFRAAEARLRLAREQAVSDDEKVPVLELLARTLVAQGRVKEAEDVYAELLALSPHAAPPADVSPKIADAFQRAKARLYPRGFVRLLVKRETVTLIDPWRGCDSVEVTGADAAQTTLPPSPGVAVALPAGARTVRALAGTRVLASAELPTGDAPVIADAPLPTAAPASSSTELVAPAVAPAPSRWPEWTLTAVAVAAAASGAACAVSASADVRAAEGAFYGSDARALGTRARGKALAANVLVGAAIASGAGAGLLWTLRW